MVRIIALALLVPASATLLSSQSKCGPQTKVSYSDAKDAAGIPIFTNVAVSDGTCIPIAKESTVVNICGPGTFQLSRMTCDQHEYKMETKEHDASAWTSNCEEVQAGGTNVDGWLGSIKVLC